MVNSTAGSYPLVRDEKEREILKFLARCVSKVGEAQARQINTIPRYNALGMGAQHREALVDLLVQADLLEVLPNVGTRIKGYESLWDLNEAVKARAGGVM
jgi:hypothetical protein